MIIVMFGEDIILRQQAKAITTAHCCEDCCVLSKIGFEQGKAVVFDVLSGRDNLSRYEKRNDLRAIVKVGNCNYLL